MVTEHFVDGKKIQIYDNVLPPHVVERWKDFYVKQATFRLGMATFDRVGNDVLFSMPLTLTHRVGVFELDQWLPQYLQNHTPRCRLHNFDRSYINMIIRGDITEAHCDIAATTPDEQYYTSCVIFANPYVPEGCKAGFTVGDIVVENKFNRMVVFDGRIEHKAIAPDDDFVRLTLYFGFSSRDTRPPYMAEYTQENKWFKTLRDT